MRRIEVLLGKQLAQVGYADLAGLVSGAIREDSDLDYKGQLYGGGDQDKRDLAGDVAAMANTVGGVIVLGIDEVDGTATKLLPVALSETEELRMRQIVTSLIAPVPMFSIHRVPHHDGQTGYYLIGVPRSVDAPHAARVNDALKYPRRDGARTRWLSESEVADAYRNRFSQATAQVERLEQVVTAGKHALESKTVTWFALGMRPNSSGRMEIRQSTISDAQTNWITPWAQNTGFGASVFQRGGFNVSAGVGKVMIFAGRAAGETVSRWGHGEFYQDGTGFAAIPLWYRHDGAAGEVEKFTDEWLLNSAVSALSMLVDHASRRCSALGDAIAEARILTSGTRWCALCYDRGDGLMSEFDGSRQVYAFPVSRHQINLEDCQTGAGLLLSVRMLLTDLIQSVGVPEVRQITSEGKLTRGAFRRGFLPSVEMWAKAKSVDISDS